MTASATSSRSSATCDVLHVKQMRIDAARECGSQGQQRKTRDNFGFAGVWMALTKARQGERARSSGRSCDESRPLHR